MRITNLSVWYRAQSIERLQALHNINLTMDPGEAIGIVGASGSGKSTLALAILQALPRNADLHGLIERTGAVAPIFQEPSGALHPLLTVGRQIAEAAYARHRCPMVRCRSEAEAALRQAGLDPREIYGAWAHQLSGGQRQRVLIAQAIVGQPQLIVADEPTASLDSITRAAILDLLKDLKNRLRMSLLFITHSPELLTGLTDRVVTMREGGVLSDC